MKRFPHVTQIGDTTGGGIGNPVFQRTSKTGGYTDCQPKVVGTPDKQIVEGKGIPPDFTILNTETDSIAGIDRMLEKGIDIIEKFKEVNTDIFDY